MSLAISQLESWDYTSLTIITVLSILIGLYHAYKARTERRTKDFLVRSRQLGVFPLILSNLATLISAIGMIGAPSETYMNGVSFSLFALGNIILLPIGLYLFIPVFYQLNQDTIFGYLELRFSLAVRIAVSVIYVIQMLFYAALAVFAPALAINQVTGLHLWTSVASVGIACAIYTSFGGIRAVVWADVTQFIVMVAVLIAIIVKGSIDVGGMSVVWEKLSLGKRTIIDTWSWSNYSQYSLWTMLIGNAVHRFSAIIANQQLMQRYLAPPTLKQSQLTYVISAFGAVLFDIGLCTMGFLMYAKYSDCDPVLDGKIKKRDQMLPLFALETLSFVKGLSGVFVAGILCATLSTLSSLLNSMTTITVSDHLRPFWPNLADRTTLKLSKILVFVNGSLVVGLAAFVGNFGGISKAVFTIFGITSGPIITIFTIGMLLPWVNSKGAIIGSLISTVIPLWASVRNLSMYPHIAHAPLDVSGCSNWTSPMVIPNATSHSNTSNFLDSFYSVSPLWYTIWSLAIGPAVSLIVSKISGLNDPSEMDSKLVFQFIHRFIEMKQVSVPSSGFVKEPEKTDDEHNAGPLLTYRES